MQRTDSLEKTLMLGKVERRRRRGWDSWMASLTQWTWVWVTSGSWWWTGRPGVLRFMGSQRIGHNWATELNWLNWDVFLELSYFFYHPADVGNLISGSSAFSKTSLNIRKFTVHILLKPGLENFEHYFISMWDECNCAVVWAFFGIAFLWDWNENWPFPVLWLLMSFPKLVAIECSTFTALSF